MKWRFLCSQDCVASWMQYGSGVGNCFNTGDGQGYGASTGVWSGDEDGGGVGTPMFPPPLGVVAIPLPEDPT